MESIKSLMREGKGATGRIDPSELLIAIVKDKPIFAEGITIRELLLLEVIGEVLDAMEHQRFTNENNSGIEVKVNEYGAIKAKYGCPNFIATRMLKKDDV